MTLKEIIANIEGVAGKQPNINTIVRSGDIYDLNSENNIRYSAFCATQQQHTEIGDFMNYAFYLYYVDRLTSDGSNKVDIQSHGISTLSNIIRTLKNNDEYEIGDVVYQPFTQRFESDCAGVYATITISVPLEFICGEDYE